MGAVINLKDFSTYRSVLMGVAIVFIMASHSLGRFALYGNIGVEWFLIISAIGQYYSLKKNPDWRLYYKRRLKRILPAYLIVAIPFFLIRYPFSLTDFLIRLSGLNLVFFWERTFWFVSLIFICYLIAPYYYQVVNKYKASIVIPFVVVAITFLLSFHMPRTQILVTRIPMFLLGMNFGKSVYEGVSIRNERDYWLCLVVSILAILLVLLINYRIVVGIELYRLIYFFCGIPSLFLILSIVKKIRFLNEPLSFLGSISYEIYLLHESIVLAICLSFPFPKIVNVLISYVIAVSLAYILHTIVNHFFKPAIR